MHIVKLAKHVQDKVLKAFGILLEPEVRLVDDKGLKEISELND
jgi:UDP-N-acetylenolpyruvoylglucosamine reductase